MSQKRISGKSAVTDWVEAYTRAWSSNSPEEIERLFTEDARYLTTPHAEPWVGSRAIVSGWRERADDPGAWEFRYEVLGTADGLAFVRGWTTYADGPRFANLWVLRLTGDGRCSEFTEWWMEE